MKKSVELKKIVDELKAKVESLQAQEQYDDAAKVANELNIAVRDYQTAVALEAADLSDFQSGAKPATDKRDEKKLLNRAFNKALLGRALTDEERAVLNAAACRVTSKRRRKRAAISYQRNSWPSSENTVAALSR